MRRGRSPSHTNKSTVRVKQLRHPHAWVCEALYPLLLLKHLQGWSQKRWVLFQISGCGFENYVGKLGDRIPGAVPKRDIEAINVHQKLADTDFPKATYSDCVPESKPLVGKLWAHVQHMFLIAGVPRAFSQA